MKTLLKYAGIFDSRKLAKTTMGVVLANSLATFHAGAALEPLPTVSYPLTQTDYSAGLQVAQFDPGLGQLDSVIISATGNGSFTQFYQNFSSTSADFFTISQNLDLILSLPSSGTGSILDLNLSSGNQTYSAQKYVSGSPFFSGASGGMANYTVAGSSSTTLPSSLPDFSQFTGFGSVNFLLTANGSSSVTETNGNYLAGGQSLAGLDLTVAYDYTPLAMVPESSTWTWMAGLFALAGMFICNSKRQSKTC